MRIKLLLFVVSFLLAGATWGGERPVLAIGDDPDRPGCDGARGRYVALLLPDRGTLVLSRAEFPGARVVGSVEGGRLVMSLPGGGGTELAVRGEDGPVWGLASPTNLEGVGPGCIAFDKDRFTWSDDLLTYVRWLVDEVYLALPAAVRDDALPLLVSDRPVVLRVVMAGRRPIEVEGKEASVVAFRLPDDDRILLLRPFVVDEAVRLVAVAMSVSDGPVLAPSEKREVGTVMVGPEPVEVVAEGVDLRLEVVAVGTSDPGGRTRFR